MLNGLVNEKTASNLSDGEPIRPYELLRTPVVKAYPIIYKEDFYHLKALRIILLEKTGLKFRDELSVFIRHSNAYDV